MPKVTFDTDRCKGCGLCIDACPKKILVMSEELNAKGYHPAAITDENECIAAHSAHDVPDVVIRSEK